MFPMTRKGVDSKRNRSSHPSSGGRVAAPRKRHPLRHFEVPRLQPLGDQGFMDTFNDKSLNCADCGQEFIFSRNEQAFYAERGFTNEPKRCKACKAKRAGGNVSS